MSTSQAPFDHLRHARSDPRVGADHRAEIVSAGLPGPLVGQTRDLGIGGACIATASGFDIRSIRRVRLHLPGGAVMLEAEGRWQREEPSEKVMLTGVSFTDLPDEVVTRLWDLVLDSGKTLARFLYGGSDLSHFSVDEAVGLAHASRWRNVTTGHYIYRGDVPRSGLSSIFIVYSGEVALQVRARGVRDHLLARLGPGRLFGGLPLVAEGLPSESAQAATDVRLLEIHESSFRYLCAAKPWLAQRLAQAVTQTYAQRAGALLARVGDAL
ncbi:MAG: cyclic nucleotide-binding domain-containing protein [Deltaproteobacteria bacterium]|nr:cyclic nucleotide-binding domain-containing protein [Deltaproteobacteria bacterium]